MGKGNSRAVRVKKPCIGCGSLTRPTPYAGPRCATCHKAFRQANSTRAHDLMVQKTYGLLPGEYLKLYLGQGGYCAICQRATGRTKRLAVDHNHSSGEVRGLCCSVCNRILGVFRDDPAILQRAVDYLLNPPARSILGRVVLPPDQV